MPKIKSGTEPAFHFASLVPGPEHKGFSPERPFFFERREMLRFSESSGLTNSR
nr:MAG TPA_asm: hypothetical protein [Caudoviricetes sp.]